MVQNVVLRKYDKHNDDINSFAGSIINSQFAGNSDEK